MESSVHSFTIKEKGTARAVAEMLAGRGWGPVKGQVQRAVLPGRPFPWLPGPSAGCCPACPTLVGAGTAGPQPLESGALEGGSSSPPVFEPQVPLQAGLLLRPLPFWPCGSSLLLSRMPPSSKRPGAAGEQALPPPPHPHLHDSLGTASHQVPRRGWVGVAAMTALRVHAGQGAGHQCRTRPVRPTDRFPHAAPAF